MRRRGLVAKKIVFFLEKKMYTNWHEIPSLSLLTRWRPGSRFTVQGFYETDKASLPRREVSWTLARWWDITRRWEFQRFPVKAPVEQRLPLICAESRRTRFPNSSQEWRICHDYSKEKYELPSNTDNMGTCSRAYRECGFLHHLPWDVV